MIFTINNTKKPKNDYRLDANSGTSLEMQRRKGAFLNLDHL